MACGDVIAQSLAENPLRAGPEELARMTPECQLQHLPIEERQGAPYPDWGGALPVHRHPTISGDEIRQLGERPTVARARPAAAPHPVSMVGLGFGTRPSWKL